MANCPKCGKELEEGIDKCPVCEQEENVITVNTEEVTNNTENNTTTVVTEIINNVENNTPQVEQDKPNQQTEQQLNSPSEVKEEEIVNQPESIEESLVQQENTITTISVDVTETFSLDDTAISNNSLETVSVEASSLILEEAKTPIQEIAIPEMPEPTIGEINPDLLGNIYDEAERINNEKIEAKRKQELAELEIKRQEEDARKLAQAQAEKPDLLAGRIPEDIQIAPQTKKKKSKVGIIIIVLLLLTILALSAYYFIVLK